MIAELIGWITHVLDGMWSETECAEGDYSPVCGQGPPGEQWNLGCGWVNWLRRLCSSVPEHLEHKADWKISEFIWFKNLIL